MKIIKKTLFCVVASWGVLLLCGFVQHQLQMSTTKIFIQQGKLTFQVRLFEDDLVSSMNNYTKKPFAIEKETITVAQKAVLEKYLLENLSMKINANLAVIKCANIRVDHTNAEPLIILDGVITGRFDIAHISKIAIKNTLLFADAPEQKNVVNIVKINEVDKTLVFNNEQDMNYLEIGY